MTSVNDLINKAAELEDQTVAQEFPDYDYPVPPAGKTIGRFSEYIELGEHPEVFKGQEKKEPVEYVRLRFDLLHPAKNIREIEVEGGKRKVNDYMIVDIPKKLNDRAKFFKLFGVMKGKQDVKHIAQLLGQAFIFNITHNETEKDGKKRTWANLWTKDGWGILPPVVEDPLAGTSQDISKQVPELLNPLRIFLWNNPTKETWDSLFIDGMREIKQPDGTTKQETKNWLQERILSAKDFEGSALQQMLFKVDKLPTEGTGQVAGQKDNTQPVVGQAKSAVADTATQETKVQTGELPVEEDPLAALGLL